MNDTRVPIGGDFSQIFDAKDYLAMLNIQDEATCILRGHLILEEVLNLWSSKVTGTVDLYSGIFVPFKTKLVISKNLGMNEDIYKVFDSVNVIRNRFSHRKGYELEKSEIVALKSKVNRILPLAKVNDCEEFYIVSEGKDQYGNPGEMTYKWAESDNRIKFLIALITLMLKLTYWIQEEFISREINYKIKK